MLYIYIYTVLYVLQCYTSYMLNKSQFSRKLSRLEKILFHIFSLFFHKESPRARLYMSFDRTLYI